MALTPSNMLPLGTLAPEFSLPNPDGKIVSLNKNTPGKAFLVMFICNHCPYVKHVADVLAQLTTEYMEKGVVVFGINSNDVKNYPEDSPEKMKLEIKARGYQFPYLYDESQSVAKTYDAACTPDFYLFDESKKLVYRGQMDSSRPGNGQPVTGSDLKEAMDAVLTHKPVSTNQKPSVGCNIKWKS